MSERYPYQEALHLLACPVCRNELFDGGDLLSCLGCGLSYPVQGGVPLLLPEAQPVERRPPDTTSNALPPDVVRLLDSTTGWSLNIGGGATPRRFPRCVELEGAIFQHTTVVGDVTAMPFVDEGFELVVALNLLEHVDDPERAAAEMLRVLHPGGRVFVHTAFLQPLHADPSHYYNATEHGVRRWFRDFDVESCSVSENFSPGYVFGWLASELLAAVHQELGERRGQELQRMTLAELAELWRDPAARMGPRWETFLRLSPAAQSRLAGGFQLVARKPTA